MWNDCVTEITKFPGMLPGTAVGKQSEHGPEAPLCPVGQGSFKMDCFKVEKCSMVRRVQM